MIEREPTLFDPKTTEKPWCLHCGSDDKQKCAHDEEIEQGSSRTRRRPKTCLNSYDPATAEIPY